MTVESGSYISDLNASLPTSTDLKAEGDDHIRLIKTLVKATFPNITGAVTATHTALNQAAAGTFASITTTGNATVGGNASVTGNATVSGNASVTGNTALTGTVGIGATVPAGQKVHIEDTSADGVSLQIKNAESTSNLAFYATGSTAYTLPWVGSAVVEGGGFSPSGQNGLILSASSGSVILQTNGRTERLRITSAGVIQDGAGFELGFKGLPGAGVTAGAFAASDRGKCVYATGGVTVPNSTMAATDVVTIINTTTSPITITASVGTLALAGTALTGNRTLAGKGIASVIFISSTSALISGAGVS